MVVRLHAIETARGATRADAPACDPLRAAAKTAVAVRQAGSSATRTGRRGYDYLCVAWWVCLYLARKEHDPSCRES